ncbi:MAG: molybdenum ABC transporter ATP-binding protein [Parvularculaceae bacterium]
MSADVLAVDVVMRFPGFDLDVEARFALDGVTAIVGPSGAGKSTLLRLIAGFARPDAGRIAFGDEVWVDVAARRVAPACARGVGVVFQDGRLFDHLTVGENLSYADRRSAKAGLTAPSRADVVERLALSRLMARSPASLSAGERQRVALGRALLARPRLLLLDEPLANLDRPGRAEILPFLEATLRDARVPALYVTHDLDEAARLADRALALCAGRIDAEGPFADVLAALADDAEIEPSALIVATLSRYDADDGVCELDFDGGRIVLPRASPPPAGAVRLRVRAGDVALATERPRGVSIRNVFDGVVDRITYAGPYADVGVAIGGTRLVARITKAAAVDLRLAAGRPVFALVKSAAIERQVARGPGGG